MGAGGVGVGVVWYWVLCLGVAHICCPFSWWRGFWGEDFSPMLGAVLGADVTGATVGFCEGIVVGAGYGGWDQHLGPTGPQEGMGGGAPL